MRSIASLLSCFLFLFLRISLGAAFPYKRRHPIPLRRPKVSRSADSRCLPASSSIIQSRRNP